MRVSVEFEDELRTTATLTIRPSWLARLLGRRCRVAWIRLDGTTWRYTFGGDYVGSDLEAVVNDRRRWEEEPSRWVSGAGARVVTLRGRSRS